VRHGQPGLPIELMVAFLYDQIQRGNPMGFFGMVQVLEGTSVAIALTVADQLKSGLGLPPQAMSYLSSHGALDQEHLKFFESLMNRVEDAGRSGRHHSLRQGGLPPLWRHAPSAHGILPMKLEGKRILLTGASGGIGEALALELAAQGAHLLLHGRRASALERLRKELPHPERHQTVTADLGSPQERARLLQHPALDDGLDVLINSAGCNQFAWLEDQSSEQVTRQLLLNVEAPIQLTRALLPRLRKPAVIMNIGSSLGAIGYAGYSVYCASKFALRGFSEALGRELEGSGIKVLHFAPRATRTHLNSEAAYAMNAELGTHTDSPQDVAEEAVIALCNETRRSWLGWPEKLFVRLNGLLPALVDRGAGQTTARHRAPCPPPSPPGHRSRGQPHLCHAREGTLR
jgi:short-subunit dehydrogenase